MPQHDSQDPAISQEPKSLQDSIDPPDPDPLQSSVLQTSGGTHAVLYRAGTMDDLVSAHKLYLESVSDLAWRMGIQDGDRIPNEQVRAEDLLHWRSILEHLTTTADQFWIAEQDGQMVGFSRSIVRDSVRELTDFFVSPQAQSTGIGSELLRRALPAGARRTYIIASSDLRAQALYHKMGLYQMCAVYTFQRKVAQPSSSPTPAAHLNSLTIVPLTHQHLPHLAEIDLAIHGYRRDPDHDWLMDHRTGFVLERDQHCVGYGYVGNPFNGPFVMLDDADYPAALLHAEEIALTHGYESLGLDVPMLNRAAIKHLLAHGYQMSPFFCFYMCDQKALHVAQTIITGPMIMI